jgi:hypothetical protein
MRKNTSDRGGKSSGDYRRFFGGHNKWRRKQDVIAT